MKTSLIFLVLMLSGCTASDQEASEAIADEGLTDPEFGGANPVWGGCSDDQEFSRSFRAMRGERVVEGTVCCSWFACSVRYN